MTLIRLHPEKITPTPESGQSQALSVLRALSDPGDDEDPFLIGFLWNGDSAMRLYVQPPGRTRIIGADIRLTDMLTWLIAALPTLIEEEERHQPAPDDPHCDLLVDLTGWQGAHLPSRRFPGTPLAALPRATRRSFTERNTQGTTVAATARRTVGRTAVIRRLRRMLVLGRSQVEALLDLDALIDALASAMTDLSAGRASSPDRVAAVVPERDGFLAAMPGFVPSAGVLMSKLVSVFPRNGGTPVPTHQALIVVFDPHTGEPAALLDGTAITAARTAACSALSARLLAREDASVLAVLGTGAQARSHAEAMCRVRPIRHIRVAGRDRAKAATLAGLLTSELDIPAEASAGYAEALDGAEIAAATTHAVDPVIRRSWLTPGVHVTSVGFNPEGREIDDATVAEALVCVDSRQAALAPFPAGSNDLLVPLREGVITEAQVHAELGELLAGSKPGRTSPDQITLYKSVGVAAQDAAAAALVVAAAREQSAGTDIRLD